MKRFIAILAGVLLAAALIVNAGAETPQNGTKPPPAPGPAPAPQGGVRTPQVVPAPQRLGDNQGWVAFVDPTKTGKICYVVGAPSKKEPANLKRGDVYVYVTHRAAEKSYNVFNFVTGYAYKDGSEVELAIDGRKFSLYTNLESAWARDAATERAIADAMAKGKFAVVKGTSSRGNLTTDTFTLAGFAQALTQIDKACGFKR